MSSGQINSDTFVPIAQEDLEQFLRDIDCIDLVRRLREDGLATCISIPPGETFTTVCEKMRQVAFSQNIRDKIIKHLTQKVESVLMTNRMSLALCWLGLLIDEARMTEILVRKTVLDDFLKQFFDHVEKVKNETKNDSETHVLSQALKLAEEDVPHATTALTFFPQIRDLYRDCPSRDPTIPTDFHVDESIWVQQLLACGEAAGVDLYPFSDVLEMSAGQIKHLILQKQQALMKECRVSVIPPNSDGVADPPSVENLPATFYSTNHLKPTRNQPVDLPPLEVYPGDQVYCFDKVNYPWKLWNVMSVSRNKLTIFDPQDPNKRTTDTATDKVATFKNAAEEGLWFPVGTLVVAWHDDGKSTTPFGYTNNYFHGVVIESPCVWNRFRYMVFFETKDPAYVRPDFVCRRLKQWENNFDQLLELNDPINFLRDYLAKWPKRPFIMANVGQTLNYDYYGNMYCGVIEEIDCSLFRIETAASSVKNTEWIHRGNKRFELMAHFLTHDLQESGGNLNQRRPHRINSSACVEVATWKDQGPYNNDDKLLPNDDTYCQIQNAFRKHKPVAKKSSISGLITRHSRKKRSKSPPPTQSAEESQGKLVNEELSNRRGGRPDVRQQYNVHTCNNNCSTEVNEALLKEKGGTRNKNPLTLPLLCGWSRLPNSTCPQKVIYYAPCGAPCSSPEAVVWFLRTTNSRLTIDMFVFDRNVDVTKRFETVGPLLIERDITNSVEPHQSVLLANKFSNERFDSFTYTNECEASDKIKAKSKGNEEDYLVGCDCTDGCSDPTKCFCRRLTSSSANQPGSTNVGFDEFRRLQNWVPTGIYECNSKCKCNHQSCTNRVVQRGLRVRLQVFKTQEKGWGVQAVDDLPLGQFICTYAGKILTSEEADKTGSEAGDEFLYDLDFLDTAIRHKQHGDLDGSSDTSSEDSGNAMEISSNGNTPAEPACHQEAYSASIVRLYHGSCDDGPFVMDAKERGNLSRFFNHSCDPNLTVQSVFVNTHDMRLPVIAFFTSRRIRAGEELTWDYSYEPASVPGRIILCKCGSSICRGRLL